MGVDQSSGLPARESIASRLFKIIFGSYFIVTLVVTVTQLAAEYRHTQTRLETEIAAMEQTFGPGIADAMWRYNDDILRGILSGMAQLPVVVGIKVEDERGTVVRAVGTVLDGRGRRQQADAHGQLGASVPSAGLFGAMFSRSFPIVYTNENGERRTIGRWSVYSDQRIVVNQVEYGFFLILVNSVIKTAALWFIFLFVVRRVLGKPLRELSDFVGALKIDNLGDRVLTLSGRGNHELHRLARKLNEMTAKLRQGVAERQALVTQLEEERDTIRQLNASLEQRVAERTADLTRDRAELARALETLQRAHDELGRSERLAALGAMVAGVAHELNTPIGNCVTVSSSLSDAVDKFAATFATGLRRSDVEHFIQETRMASDLLSRNTERASNLVSSFKQVAVDQTSAQRRRFVLAEVVRENIQALSATLRHTPFVLEQVIAPDLELDSFPGPLGQVLFNLVNNALLHAFKGRDHGVMRLAAHATEPGWLELSFTDDGAGIAPENLKRIFDPFFTTRLGEGGSGLGLSITHNLVTTVLGGRIQVRSTIGVGTTFVLQLPLEAPHQTERLDQAA